MNKEQLQWINIFLRDIFLIFVVAGLHYLTYFNSKTVWLITGMLMVWITWQLSDLLEQTRRLT